MKKTKFWYSIGRNHKNRVWQNENGEYFIKSGGHLLKLDSWAMQFTYKD